ATAILTPVRPVTRAPSDSRRVPQERARPRGAAHGHHRNREPAVPSIPIPERPPVSVGRPPLDGGPDAGISGMPRFRRSTHRENRTPSRPRNSIRLKNVAGPDRECWVRQTTVRVAAFENDTRLQRILWG